MFYTGTKKVQSHVQNICTSRPRVSIIVSEAHLRIHAIFFEKIKEPVYESARQKCIQSAVAGRGFR